MHETLTAATEIEVTGLVKKSLDGDVEAYGQLYALYLDRIYRYIFYQIRDEMKAQDITQEVFIKAWKAIKTCGGKENTFKAWLYRIAHNHLVDTIRKTHQYVPLEVSDPGDNGEDIEQNVESSIEQQNVLRLVDDLPIQQRQIIILKFIEGYDNAEIAQITGKRQGAIRAIQLRALNSLRQRLRVEVSSVE
jgi:RNA polymerase sigma-70 factor, ECF subfamily